MKISQITPNLFIKIPTQQETDLIQSIKDKLETINLDDLPSIEQVVARITALVKQEMTNFDGSFGVLSVNGRSGMVELTAKDLGAEPSFLKRSAFNRSFGKTATTVCEGNDPRLSDKRIPVEHHHDALDIDGLQNAIGMNEKLLDVQSLSHRHHNARILDLLVYTGTQSQLDLTLLDNLDFSQEDIIQLQKHQTDAAIHVTADQKTMWDDKETKIGAQQKASRALSEANIYTDSAIQQLTNRIVSGASSEYATLKAIESVIKEKVFPHLAGSDNQTWGEVQVHMGSQNLHLTEEQRQLIAAIPLKASINHTHEMIRYKTFTTVDDLF